MRIRALAAFSLVFAVLAGIIAAIQMRGHAESGQGAPVRNGLAGPTGQAPAPQLPAGADPEGLLVLPGPVATAEVSAPPPAVATTTWNDGIGEMERLKDPEYRKARLAAVLPTLASGFPGLVEELRLTSLEAERFFSELADNQLDRKAEGSALSDDDLDPAVRAEIMQVRRDRQRRQGESLRTVLGDARYGQWQEYQRTQSARLQAGTYADALEQAGVPLDSTQTRIIATALIEEEERMRQDVVALARTVNLQNPQTQAQAQTALKQRQDESAQRVLDAIFPYLSAPQLRALRSRIGQ